MTGLRKARGTKDEGRRLMATQIDGVSALNKFAECPDCFNGSFFFLSNWPLNPFTQTYGWVALAFCL